MSSFTKQLEYQQIDKELYITLEPFTFYLTDPDKDFVLIKEGTIFNGASIPKLIQRIFNWKPLDTRWLQASIVHDALVGEFEPPVLATISGTLRKVSWSEASRWFDVALAIKSEQNSCPKIDRNLFILSIKFYGFFRKTKQYDNHHIVKK